MAAVSFFVPGTPVPKGSAKAWVNRRTGRAIVTHDNKDTKSWQGEVRGAAVRAGVKPTTDPVQLSVCFLMPRPKGHFGVRGVRPAAPRHPAVKPDLDKLLRTVMDALTAVAYVDDAQVVRLGLLAKRYAQGGETPGVYVEIELLPAQAGAEVA